MAQAKKVKVGLTSKQRAILPKFDGLPKRFWRDAGVVLQGNILHNIMSGVQGDGTPIKQNSPAVKRRKPKYPRGRNCRTSVTSRLKRHLPNQTILTCRCLPRRSTG